MPKPVSVSQLREKNSDHDMFEIYDNDKNKNIIGYSWNVAEKMTLGNNGFGHTESDPEHVARKEKQSKQIAEKINGSDAPFLLQEADQTLIKMLTDPPPKGRGLYVTWDQAGGTATSKVAIVTKTQPLLQQQIPLDDFKFTNSNNVDDNHFKGIVKTETRMPDGNSLITLNVHLKTAWAKNNPPAGDTRMTAADKAELTTQIDKLIAAEKTKNPKATVLVAGDFNRDPSDYSHSYKNPVPAHAGEGSFSYDSTTGQSTNKAIRDMVVSSEPGVSCTHDLSLTDSTQPPLRKAAAVTPPLPLAPPPTPMALGPTSALAALGAKNPKKTQSLARFEQTEVSPSHSLSHDQLVDELKQGHIPMKTATQTYLDNSMYDRDRSKSSRSADLLALNSVQYVLGHKVSANIGMVTNNQKNKPIGSHGAGKHGDHAMKIQFSSQKEAKQFTKTLFELGIHSTTSGPGHAKTVQNDAVYLTADDVDKIAKQAGLINQEGTGKIAYKIKAEEFEHNRTPQKSVDSDPTPKTFGIS